MWLLLSIALAGPPPETSRLDRSGLCEVLPEDAVLVEYVLDDEQMGAWVLDPDDCGELTWLDLGDATPVLERARRFHDLVSTGALEGRFERVGKPLTEALITPVDVRVGAHSRWLVLTPPGALAELPWAALPLDGGYLVEQRTVGLVDDVEHLFRPSPGWLPESVRMVRGEAYGALLVGGVDFHEPEADPCGPEALPPLPDTLREVRRVRVALGAKVPRWATTLLRGEEATREATLQSASQRRFLHWATHGFARAECPQPLRGSGLALADAPITAADISQLDLTGTELVVLSACDTAVGADVHSEGLYGLRQAFLRAGARSLVVTLWPVEDKSTRWLMVRLYVSLLGRRSTEVAQALGDAQRALLARNRRRYGDAMPATWAAFVASGSWTRGFELPPALELQVVPRSD